MNCGAVQVRRHEVGPDSCVDQWVDLRRIQCHNSSSIKNSIYAHHKSTLFSMSILRVENLKCYRVICFMEFLVNSHKKKSSLSLVLWGLCLKLAQSELWKEPEGKVLNFGDNVKVKRETKRNVSPRFVK